MNANGAITPSRPVHETAKGDLTVKAEDTEDPCWRRSREDVPADDRTRKQNSVLEDYLDRDIPPARSAGKEWALLALRAGGIPPSPCPVQGRKS